MDLAGERKKMWNMKVKVILIVVGALRTFPKSLQKRLEELEISERIETNQTTALQNTEKSPGDLKRLDADQTPVKNYYLTPVWKTHKVW